MSRQQNILYLHSHDTGRYVEPYGHPAPAPNLRRLAEEGVLFRQAFCAAPTCSPSRASLLTGRYPHNNGMLGLTHRGFGLHDFGQHIVRTLSSIGYRTVLSGIQHEAHSAEDIGYDEILDVGDQRAGSVASAAARFLEEAPKEPFFLSVGFFETHRPFPEPGPEDDPRYVLPLGRVPDAIPTREDAAAYRASVRALDEGLGMVLRALRANELEEDTLVICTTDHGPAFPGMKCNMTDDGMGVMLILRGPKGLAGGRIVDAMVSQIDLFPTICDLLGTKRPDWLQGESLLPLVSGEVARIRDEVVAEVNYHAAYEPQRAVRTVGWKYIRRFEERGGPTLPNCDPGPSRDLLLERGWTSQVPEMEQLYDLTFDPGERNNLVGDPHFGPQLEDMRRRLDRWMHETEDPLLWGPVPAPLAAHLEDPNTPLRWATGYAPS